MGQCDENATISFIYLSARVEKKFISELIIGTSPTPHLYYRRGLNCIDEMTMTFDPKLEIDLFSIYIIKN